MLDPDRRQTERKAKRDDQKVIVCLLAGLLCAIVFAGAVIATSLLWPAEAYPRHWDYRLKQNLCHPAIPSPNCQNTVLTSILAGRR
jgi:hypothetical protein